MSVTRVQFQHGYDNYVSGLAKPVPIALGKVKDEIFNDEDGKICLELDELNLGPNILSSYAGIFKSEELQELNDVFYAMKNPPKNCKVPNFSTKTLNTLGDHINLLC